MIDALAALEQVAALLEEAGIEVVFAGGAILPFYVSDKRGTEDVDCIADASEPELGTSLRRAGFTHNVDSRVVVRWDCAGFTVDIVPRTGYYGFGTRWNELLFLRACVVTLPGGRRIRIASPGLLLLLKIDAFADRGMRDPMASRDGADIAALAVECADLVTDLRSLPSEARTHAARWAESVLADPNLLEPLEINTPRGRVPDPGTRFVKVLREIAAS